jgi:Na+-transporting NADH:ubiquinone oxidoreductase subunit NqrB
VAQKNQLKSTAVVMGAVGLVVIGMGLAILLFDDQGRGSNLGGLLIRVGAVLGAVALVLPSIRKPSISTLVVAGLGLVLVLARPALVWAALIGWAVWVLLGRQRSRSSSDS